MKIVYILGILFSFTCSLPTTQKSLTALLEDDESSYDQRYYDLLPTAQEKGAHISFIRSRHPENMSLEESFIKMIAKATLADTIVETGTYKGQTTEKMATFFKNVYTIELSNELYGQAKKRFKENKNVHCHQGDSAQVLPNILKQLKTKTVFFLDAHFSLGDTAQGSENTPILTELNLIKKAGITDAIIIIDDMRMFYKPTYKLRNTFAEGYPTVNDLVEKIVSINSSYQIAIVYDTLIAFPSSDKITVSLLVKAVTMSRLYNNENYVIDHILMAELYIAKAQNKEKETLLDLAQRWIEPWSTGSFISSHYALWAGLLAMEQQEYAKAMGYFVEAKKRGLHHWRIDWYMAMAQATCFFDIA